ADGTKAFLSRRPAARRAASAQGWDDRFCAGCSGLSSADVAEHAAGAVARRIVLTCWGSYGDLFPFLAIAVRLKALGHSPVLATSAFYREIVEREGVEFRQVRPDIDPADTETIRRVMDPARG